MCTCKATSHDVTLVHIYSVLLLCIICPLGYRLVIVCTNEGEERSHFISKLHAHQQQYTPIHTIADFCMYLKSKFTTTSPAQKQFKGKLACNVDHERYDISIVK